MQEEKRAQNVSLVGLILQIIISGVMLALWLATGSQSLMVGVLMLAGGSLLWIMLAVLFSARRMAAVEAREIEQLQAQSDQGRIFEDADRLASRPAQARAEAINKWALPIFTVLLAGFYVGVGLWAMGQVADKAELQYLPASIVILLLTGFVSFLFSRYCLGMGSVDVWRPLRAAGSLLFVFTLFQMLIAMALFLAVQGYPTLGRDGMAIDSLAALILPVVMFVYAAEILVNLILDIYRPRMPGQTPHPPFDSRLLNLLAQPSKVGHSLAETLNYQFGFEVSATWFYKIVSRAFLPLLVFALVLIALMSSLVIVHPNQRAVVLTFGKLDTQRQPMGPGLNVKWPWPIQTVRFFEKEQIKQFVIGADQEAYSRAIPRGPQGQRTVLLWSKRHQGEDNILVAMPPRRDAPQSAQARGAGLANLVLIVRYKISDVYTYGFRFADPDQLLQTLARSEMIRLAARSTLIEDEQSMVADPRFQGVRSVMTTGRGEFAERVQENLLATIEREFGPEGLGVEILDVSLVAAHPPAGGGDRGGPGDTGQIDSPAEAFEDVINARLGRIMQQRQAEAEANETLASVGGDPAVATLLALSISARQQVSELRGYLQAEPEQRQQFRQALGRGPGTAEDGTRIEASGYIGAAGEEVARYEEQVAQERLIGRINPQLAGAEEMTPSELIAVEANRSLIMLRAWQRHLRMLEQIRTQATGADGYPFARQIAVLDDRINELMESASGEPARLIAEARAERRRIELAGRTRSEAFKAKLAAFRASKAMYRLDRYLDVLESELPEIPSKVALGIGADRVEIRHDRTGRGNPLSAIPWGSGEQTESPDDE